MVDGFSCILDFPGEDPRTPPPPLIMGIHQLNPQNLSWTTTTVKGKKKKKKKALESPPPLKQSTRNLFLGYTEIEKRRRVLGQDLFVWFVIGLFETLICAKAEDKVCDSCIVSSWALLIFLLCLWWWWPNSNFQFCVITQNGESSRDLLLSVTNRKLWLLGGTAPAEPPFKTLITLLPVTFSQLDLQLGCWLWKKVSTLIGYLLTDGSNCL